MATHSNVSLTATSIGAGGTGTIAVQNGTGAILSNAIWSNVAKTTAQGKLQLEGEGADIVMNGVSLKEILDGITDRLSILQPKPELLAKYDNLREAYEHYKTLEALLHEDDNDK